MNGRIPTKIDKQIGSFPKSNPPQRMIPRKKWSDNVKYKSIYTPQTYALLLRKDED